MHKDVVKYIICPHCKGEDLHIRSFELDVGEILDGAVVCADCNSWLRIENGILDLLLPPLRNQKRYERFASKYDLEVVSIGSEESLTKETPQQQQINFFAIDSECYEQDVTKSPYFDTLDDVVFKKWVVDNIPKNSKVLEVGAGTGRQSVRVAKAGASVLGVDISEEMLVVAREVAISKGVQQYVDLVVADACQLPLKTQAFEAGVAVGTLHHVPDPGKVLRRMGCALKEGAPVFTYDPHDSPVRFVFDGMMKWWKLYDEEASDDPLINRTDIVNWTNDASMSGQVRMSTYLPPHFFYLFSESFNRKMLVLTDSFFSKIPWVKNCGGMIIFEGFKKNMLN